MEETTPFFKLAFLGRNLKICPLKLRKTLHIVISLEYSHYVFIKIDGTKLEKSPMGLKSNW